VTDRERRFDLDHDFPLPPVHSGMTPSEAEFAADLSAVQADDALLDALGGSDPKIADGLGDLELNALLLAWRRDIDSEPLADLVDTDTAVTTVKTAALAKRHAGRGRKRRMLVPVAAAAAVLAIAFTGTGLAARDAQPGDTLWGLTKVLYSDHARSIEAAAAARVDLQTANIALAGGRINDARKALDNAQAALKQVAVEDNLNQLMQQHRELSAQLESPNPAPTHAPVIPASPSTLPPSQTKTQPPPPTSSQLPAGTGGGTTTPPSSTTSTPPPASSTPTPTPSTTPPASGTGSKPGSNPGSSPRYSTSSDTSLPTSAAAQPAAAQPAALPLGAVEPAAVVPLAVVPPQAPVTP
jgi:hypothetical protein